VLAPLMAAGTPNVRDFARRLMGRIVDYEAALAANRSSLSTIPPPPDGPTLPTTLSTAPAAPVTRPVFRQVKADEQRLEATFERIECVAGKGVTFSFRAGPELVTATATKFDDVEFITYRDDLTGTLTCGPIKEPMRVYLTWRPGQTEGTKIAVAIEFLPKGG
jgi:hypothetical protein